MVIRIWTEEVEGFGLVILVKLNAVIINVSGERDEVAIPS